MGFQALGSSPRWTRRNWNPTSLRTFGGNARTSVRDEPSQKRGLSATGGIYKYSYNLSTPSVGDVHHAGQADGPSLRDVP